ncbi:chromosomal replication initiation protein [Sagittula stellata E-37]|uniref:Chromosomal replication initiation protein n=1 Tax=Sagittula stellata (strain ATCC 700073 / DSM 11524 / E-37) TaxID=388399 RepID=A3K330_SAGS3|nr:chromosomal replication initiation protein [Sagittula stellata E-37]
MSMKQTGSMDLRTEGTSGAGSRGSSEQLLHTSNLTGFERAVLFLIARDRVRRQAESRNGTEDTVGG